MSEWNWERSPEFKEAFESDRIKRLDDEAVCEKKHPTKESGIDLKMEEGRLTFESKTDSCI